MFRVFNMGIGMVLIVSPASTNAILRTLKRRGEQGWLIGKVARGQQDVNFITKS
jgi:phosphoribosylformylglycinamidine cyclo-ligase